MPHTSIELEHRLTVVEVTQESHARTLRGQCAEIAALRRQQITPRDWLMIAAGILAIIGALAGKIEWGQALSVLTQK